MVEKSRSQPTFGGMDFAGVLLTGEVLIVIFHGEMGIKGSIRHQLCRPGILWKRKASTENNGGSKFLGPFCMNFAPCASKTDHSGVPAVLVNN